MYTSHCPSEIRKNGCNLMNDFHRVKYSDEHFPNAYNSLRFCDNLLMLFSHACDISTSMESSFSPLFPFSKLLLKLSSIFLDKLVLISEEIIQGIRKSPIVVIFQHSNKTILIWWSFLKLPQAANRWSRFWLLTEPILRFKWYLFELLSKTVTRKRLF